MLRRTAIAFGLLMLGSNVHAAREFTALLEGSQVVPATTETGRGIGVGVLTGGPGTWSFAYSVIFTGFDFGTNFGSGAMTAQLGDDVRNFHIHTADIGAGGPLVYSVRQPDYEAGAGPTITFLAPTVVNISGTWDLLDGNTNANPPANTAVGNLNFWAQQMLAAQPGEAIPLYFDIHTEAFPGSAIRGQLVAAVPEPEAYALMLTGLGLIGWAARRRSVAATSV